MTRILVTLAILLAWGGAASAQPDDERYVPETDPLVLANLAHWQDVKFGLLMHWGPYSQWGVVESWSICAEDEGWCKRSLDDYIEYKRRYEGLKKTFNPVRFDPGTWARAARDAGMKYVVFTTKHHDGFSMFDSKYTDYKVTSPETPFHTNPKANIAKEVFDAFRAEGFKVNGPAIYESRPIAPYTDGRIRMTSQKDGSVFFLYLADENETVMPKEIRVTSHRPAEGATVTLLGVSAPLTWRAEADGFVVAIPRARARQGAVPIRVGDQGQPTEPRRSRALSVAQARACNVAENFPWSNGPGANEAFMWRPGLQIRSSGGGRVFRSASQVEAGSSDQLLRWRPGLQTRRIRI